MLGLGKVISILSDEVCNDFSLGVGEIGSLEVASDEG